MIRKEIIQNFSLNFVKMLKQFNYIIIFALLIISCNKNNVIEINTPQLLKSEPLSELSMRGFLGLQK
ncbi:MAG: hypothetical protein CM1200mP1_04620 [Candidatus Neomarinimicrobiota bacterium]|nr:MAG: hypothetical protein CM1200mP1_04620 [Candidatus Neomarinimicrobiota bacterium]